MRILLVSEGQRQAIREVISREWGSSESVSRGRLTKDVSAIHGLAALDDAGEMLGFVMFQYEGGECEVTSLFSLREGCGIGSALMAAAEDAARTAGCRYLWLTTSNDNTHALRFYQKLGYRIAAVRVDAYSVYRQGLKPLLPLLGHDGISLRDEIELVKDL